MSLSEMDTVARFSTIYVNGDNFPVSFSIS